MYLDKHAMKPAILVLTAVSCVGSLIYGFATNVWMLLVGTRENESVRYYDNESIVCCDTMILVVANRWLI
jgi:hypothetical protein